MTGTAYSFSYTGETGLGFGVLFIEDGIATGRDFLNGRFVGTAVELDDGTIEVNVTMHVPPNVTLVTGASGQEVPHQRQITHRFPARMGDGVPQTLMVAGSTVNAFFKEIPSDSQIDWRSVAHDGFTLAVARQMGWK